MNIKPQTISTPNTSTKFALYKFAGQKQAYYAAELASQSSESKISKQGKE